VTNPAQEQADQWNHINHRKDADNRSDLGWIITERTLEWFFAQAEYPSETVASALRSPANLPSTCRLKKSLMMKYSLSP
jgi:hypothetical protein